jgi:flagellar hook-associated protein 3 FlgL
VPPVTGTWTSGEAIPAPAAGLGVEFKITGAPAAGDSFTIETAPNQDIFTTLQNLADTLLAPGNSPADNAMRVNAYTNAIGDISTAQSHIMSIRTDVGARMNNIETASDNSSLQSLTLKESLSNLRDTNAAEAISQLSMHLLALEAAHKVTLQSQGMSLFSRL